MSLLCYGARRPAGWDVDRYEGPGISPTEVGRALICSGPGLGVEDLSHQSVIMLQYTLYIHILRILRGSKPVQSLKLFIFSGCVLLSLAVLADWLLVKVCGLS